MIRGVSSSPLVIKLLEGTEGKGVVLADTRKAAESVIQAFMETNNNILVQEYIRETGGFDIRGFVIGNKTKWSLRFAGKPSRANFAVICTAVKAARYLGLNVCGVDILR